jgi:hypothetical protein
MIFVDKKKTMRMLGAFDITSTSIIVYVLPIWFFFLWVFAGLSALGAVGALLLTIIIAVPLFMRFPYRQCLIDDRGMINLKPLTFLGVSIGHPITIDPSDPAIEWNIIKRMVNIAPRQGAPYVLTMKRPGHSPVWLACSVSEKYLERELRMLVQSQV